MPMEWWVQVRSLQRVTAARCVGRRAHSACLVASASLPLPPARAGRCSHQASGTAAEPLHSTTPLPRPPPQPLASLPGHPHIRHLGTEVPGQEHVARLAAGAGGAWEQGGRGVEGHYWGRTSLKGAAPTRRHKTSITCAKPGCLTPTQPARSFLPPSLRSNDVRLQPRRNQPPSATQRQPATHRSKCVSLRLWRKWMALAVSYATSLPLQSRGGSRPESRWLASAAHT